MTLKQNGRKGDEKITTIHSILPGDVIYVAEKGEREGKNDKKTRSQRVSTRDTTQREAVKEQNETDRMERKAGDLRCIPLISRPQPLSRDAS